MSDTRSTMKVDIWSDIRCPFCYIGKRKFEMALERFPQKDKVTVTWHSFELDPGVKTQPEVNVLDYLAKIKGITREEAAHLHDHVTEVAHDVGLTFRFDRSVLANSFNGHRLIQLAKVRGVANETEEALFRAHFTDGKNIDDPEILVAIGAEAGIPRTEIEGLFSSDNYAKEVRDDQAQARAIGIRGVPFFIFNNKYAVSGAQSPDFFLQTLSKAWADFQETKPVAPL
jgi:predicted DsbA family dithiol-disulfide isomerase